MTRRRWYAKSSMSTQENPRWFPPQDSWLDQARIFELDLIIEDKIEELQLDPHLLDSLDKDSLQRVPTDIDRLLDYGLVLTAGLMVNDSMSESDFYDYFDSLSQSYSKDPGLFRFESQQFEQPSNVRVISAGYDGRMLRQWFVQTDSLYRSRRHPAFKESHMDYVPRVVIQSNVFYDADRNQAFEMRFNLESGSLSEICYQNPQKIDWWNQSPAKRKSNNSYIEQTTQKDIRGRNQELVHFFRRKQGGQRITRDFRSYQIAPDEELVFLGRGVWLSDLYETELLEVTSHVDHKAYLWDKRGVDRQAVLKVDWELAEMLPDDSFLSLAVQTVVLDETEFGSVELKLDAQGSWYQGGLAQIECEGEAYHQYNERVSLGPAEFLLGYANDPESRSKIMVILESGGKVVGYQKGVQGAPFMGGDPFFEADLN